MEAKQIEHWSRVHQIEPELKEAWVRWLSENWSWDWWVTLPFRGRGDGLPIGLGYIWG